MATQTNIDRLAAARARAKAAYAKNESIKIQPETATATPTTGIESYNQVINALPQADLDRLRSFTLKTIGKQPQSAEEYGLLVQGAFTPEEIQSKGLTSLVSSQSPNPALGLQLAQARTAMTTTQEAANQAQEATVPTLRVLENALKIRTDVGQQPIGESELFQKAGIGGFDVLSQSLNQRMKEIDYKSQSFRSVLADAASVFQGQNQALIDNAKVSLQKYDALREEYKTAQDYLHDIEMQAKDHEYDLDLMMQKASIDAQVVAQVVRH